MLRRRRSRAAAPTGAQPPGAPGDLTALDPRWRAAVEEVLASRHRLQAIAAQAGAGGLLHERFTSIADRVDAGVVAAWNIASRAQAASRTLAAMGLDGVSGQLKETRRRLADAERTSAAAEVDRLRTEVQMLADQHAALHQLSNAIDDASERLRLLDLRLDAAVARAAAVALLPNADDELANVERDLIGVVDELEALRAGLDAVRALDA